GELVHAEHLARYLFAAPLARGRAVLDAACGEGYGTDLLARAGAVSAVGIDVDPAAVEHARARYGHGFRQADVVELPFEDGAFQLVVSFETIEHVADPARAVAELRRVLATDGVLIVSTPNRDEYRVGTEFHVREFTPDEFLALLRPHFAQIAVAYQQNWLTSAILDADAFAADDPEAPLDARLSKAAGRAPGQELYTIAVCGAADVPAEVAVATEVYEAHRLANDVVVAKQAVEDWQARATEAERLVEEWNARALEAERQLGEARAARRSVEESLSWRVTAPLRALRRGSRDR
ncbi:MAG: class I SAM-dependent methyltransferase, partial [Actinomycetota bacterium]|nr:class I SAM-dependent methyltransferase [Actinomycetota bacterium]